MVSTLSILRAALKKVPSLKYALGVAGVAAAVAIVAGFQLDMRIAVFGTVLMFGFMFVLVAFSALATSKAVPALVKIALPAAQAFVWLTWIAAVLLLSSYFFGWPRPLLDYMPLEVKVAEVMGVNGHISPTRCTFSAPCGTLERGSTLHIELMRRGYAAVFIQDKGKYYNQESRLIISKGTSGDTRLWPGTDSSIDSQYPLWVVTSETKLTPHSESNPLDELPDGCNGQAYGPIYLSTIYPDSHVEDNNNTPSPQSSTRLYCACHAGRTFCFLNERDCQEKFADRGCAIQYTNSSVFDLSDRSKWLKRERDWYTNSCILTGSSHLP